MKNIELATGLISASGLAQPTHAGFSLVAHHAGPGGHGGRLGWWRRCQPAGGGDGSRSEGGGPYRWCDWDMLRHTSGQGMVARAWWERAAALGSDHRR
jgi:hypothetical protein